MSPPADAFDTQENVLEVRNALGEEWNPMADEETIKRCLRADKGHKENTVNRLVKTLKWRQDTIPNPNICRCCTKDYTSHYLHQVGFDKIGRPVLYSVFNLATNMNPEDNVQHMIHTFEHAISVMGPKLEQQQWVWISDFNGFGFQNLNPNVALSANTLFSTYYPERLGAFILVGAPSIFSMLYSAISPAIDQVTKKKLIFVNKDSSMKEKLSDLFDDEMVDWIAAEVKQNDNKALRKKKRYASTDVEGEEQFGTVADAPYMRGSAVVDGHNIHGTSSFQKFLQHQDLAWQQTFCHVTPSASESK